MSLFRTGMSILCLISYAILAYFGNIKLSGFTCSQLERNFASGQIISQILTISDLDDVLEKTLNII